MSVEDKIRAARAEADAKVMISVTLEFPDGHGERREWTWGEVQKPGGAPNLAALGELQDWMIDPRKTWPRPQEPVAYSAIVAQGREADALAWLDSLSAPSDKEQGPG